MQLPAKIQWERSGWAKRCLWWQKHLFLLQLRKTQQYDTSYPNFTILAERPTSFRDVKKAAAGCEKAMHEALENVKYETFKVMEYRKNMISKSDNRKHMEMRIYANRKEMYMRRK